MSITTMDAAELADRIHGDADDPFILDVRNEADYEEWAIPGSFNLPIYDQLLDHTYDGLEASLDQLPEDEPIVVVCVAGVTSARAAEFLRKRGYDASSVEDGMNGWGRVHRQYAVDGVDRVDRVDVVDGVDGVAGVVQIVRPGTGCVSYVVHDGEAAVVVDPSLYVDRYLDAADGRDLSIVGVVDTHAHADHVSGARRLAGELDVPYYLHPADAGSLEGITGIEDGDSIAVGDRTLHVRHTPGHTPGSVSLLFGDAVLTGDTLFLRSVGRPDLEDDSEDAIRAASDRLYDSIDGLTALADETIVLPGHISDESIRPVAISLGALRRETTNELLGYVEAGNRTAFVETIVESLAAQPANYNEIKQINWGNEQPGGDIESLELGPNNCAAN